MLDVLEDGAEACRMKKPTPQEWERLANLNQHNARQVADMKTDLDAGIRIKKGRALRIQSSLRRAVRMEADLKKRAGIS